MVLVRESKEKTTRWPLLTKQPLRNHFLTEPSLFSVNNTYHLMFPGFFFLHKPLKNIILNLRTEFHYLTRVC